MGIDFSGLVLAPAMATFGRSVLVTPLKSQPNVAPFAARGVWTVESISIPTEDGGTLSTVRLKFGIRLVEFPTAPKQGDWITTAASELPFGYWQGAIDPTSSIDFIIDDFTPDGQGGALLILKRVQ